MSTPPPPPPHGEVPKGSGLPPGKYDIFVIPQHSAGSGFLYLPSLKPNVNSFVAGFASALILVALFQSMAPAFRAWWETFNGIGNMGVLMIMVGVGFGAWALGRIQTDGQAGPGFGAKPDASGHGANGSSNFQGSHSAPPPNGNPPNGQAPPPPPPRHDAPPPPGPEKPQGSSWQQQQRPSPQPKTAKPETKGSWEKARDEMRKKEEERKAKEADKKRREDLAKRLAELRAKEAKERMERDKEKQRKEKEAKDKEDAAKKEKEAKEKEKETATAAANAARAGSSYAYSGVGEKMSMWPNGKPPAPPQHSPTTPKSPPSPKKRPPAPTARTYISTDEDAFSYRPYDKPKQPQRKKSTGSLASESSWAASHTTARTSPPHSMRGPYTTKDPDKVVIQAVYLFMNQYAKTPASQLISGVGSVTDGLILRITTEGLFIDDDVRGVPQREWDVKAWTLKLAEVWCPPHCLNSASASSNSANKGGNFLHKMAAARARNADRDASKPLVGDEADAYLTEMLRSCKECCRLGLCDSKLRNTNIPPTNGQTGEWKSKGLHLLRATVRDQDGKRYLFVVDETEYWKVGIGLQRLRRGTQVRQLGITSMNPSEARNQLETLGWAL